MTIFDLIKSPMKVLRNYRRLEEMQKVSDRIIKQTSDKIQELQTENNKLQYDYDHLRDRHSNLVRLCGKEGPNKKVEDQRRQLRSMHEQVDRLKETIKQLKEDNSRMAEELKEYKLKFEHYGAYYCAE